MVIDSNSVNNGINSAKSKAGTTKEAYKPGAEDIGDKDSKLSSSGDEVSLSAQAKSLAALETAVTSAPEINTGRVNDVRSALHTGQYRINAEVIAEKILKQDISI